MMSVLLLYRIAFITHAESAWVINNLLMKFMKKSRQVHRDNNQGLLTFYFYYSFILLLPSRSLLGEENKMLVNLIVDLANLPIYTAGGHLLAD